ncbi:meso-butanediol dehydrogenase / (S,S)-butanediol dehydrogenase / diacetyl reductase, partial [Candidatus Hakubella thermalkaliphila]
MQGFRVTVKIKVGVSRILPFLETTEEIWDETLAVNLKGTFLCCQAVIPHLLRQGKGKSINLSSKSGKRGT